jgi:hypothetical protein
VLRDGNQFITGLARHPASSQCNNLSKINITSSGIKYQSDPIPVFEISVPFSLGNRLSSSIFRKSQFLRLPPLLLGGFGSTHEIFGLALPIE